MRKSKMKSEMRNWLMISLFVVLMSYLLISLLPIMWAIISSFKEKNEFFDDVLGFPSKLPGDHIFSNYVEAYDQLTYMTTKMQSFTVLQQFGNSLLYVVGCTVAATLTPCVVAYVVARFRYKFLNILYTIVILVMALPVVGSLPSEVQMAKSLGFYQEFWGLWLMKANFLGTYFLVFHAQFTMIPKDYTEAAKVDGASPFRVMAQIIMPLAWSTISTVGVLNFIMFWNDYQTPLIYLETKPVLAVGIFNFYSSYRVTNNAVKLAGLIMLTVPIVIVFVIFQNKLMANLSIGGIKS